MLYLVFSYAHMSNNCIFTVFHSPKITVRFCDLANVQCSFAYFVSGSHRTNHFIVMANCLKCMQRFDC